jgi:heme-degrading monooxygenase HmoA
VIARIWRGWALPDGAAAYQRYYTETLTPELRRIPGFRGGHLLRREVEGAEVELVTITWFESLDAVRRFAGEAYERAVVSERALALLTRHERTCQHFEVAARATGEPPERRPRVRPGIP